MRDGFNGGKVPVFLRHWVNHFVLNDLVVIVVEHSTKLSASLTGGPCNWCIGSEEAALRGDKVLCFFFCVTLSLPLCRHILTHHVRQRPLATGTTCNDFRRRRLML